MPGFRFSKVTAAVLATAAFSVAASAGPRSASQDPTANKEVQDLIANATTPADHTALAKHFAAIAAQYTAEGNQYASMADLYRSNPTTKPGIGNPMLPSERVAKSSKESARAVQELATFHEGAAKDTSGTSSKPINVALLQRIDQSKVPDLIPSKQLTDLVKRAKTPAEHTRLAKHFVAVATRFAADADRYAAMAAGYKANPTQGITFATVQCGRMAKESHEADNGARGLAAYHQKMADQAEKK